MRWERERVSGNVVLRPMGVPKWERNDSRAESGRQMLDTRSVEPATPTCPVHLRRVLLRPLDKVVRRPRTGELHAALLHLHRCR